MFLLYSLKIFLLVYIGFVDVKTLYIPDKLLGYLFIVAIIYTIFAWNLVIFMQQIIGLFCGFCLFFFVYKFVGGMGYGDVKFSALLGFTLGIYGWFVAMFLAVVSAVCIFIFLYLKGRWTVETKIPFGPFISFGGVVVIVTRLLWI